MLASLLTQRDGLSSEDANLEANRPSSTLGLECKHLSSTETDPAPKFLNF